MVVIVWEWVKTGIEHLAELMPSGDTQGEKILRGLCISVFWLLVACLLVLYIIWFVFNWKGGLVSIGVIIIFVLAVQFFHWLGDHS